MLLALVAGRAYIDFELAILVTAVPIPTTAAITVSNFLSVMNSVRLITFGSA